MSTTTTRTLYAITIAACIAFYWFKRTDWMQQELAGLEARKQALESVGKDYRLEYVDIRERIAVIKHKLKRKESK